MNLYLYHPFWGHQRTKMGVYMSKYLKDVITWKGIPVTLEWVV
jgi:hypothetical protein